MKPAPHPAVRAWLSARTGGQGGTSHAIFKTPWVGDPRINIQDDKGKAKPYQVRQVLLAIQKLEDIHHAN